MNSKLFSQIAVGDVFFWDNNDGLGPMEFRKVLEKTTSSYRTGPQGAGIYADRNNVRRVRDGAYTWFDPHDVVSVR